MPTRALVLMVCELCQKPWMDSAGGLYRHLDGVHKGLALECYVGIEVDVEQRRTKTCPVASCQREEALGGAIGRHLKEHTTLELKTAVQSYG